MAVQGVQPEWADAVVITAASLPWPLSAVASAVWSMARPPVVAAHGIFWEPFEDLWWILLVWALACLALAWVSYFVRWTGASHGLSKFFRPAQGPHRDKLATVYRFLPAAGLLAIAVDFPEAGWGILGSTLFFDALSTCLLETGGCSGRMRGMQMVKVDQEAPPASWGLDLVAFCFLHLLFAPLNPFTHALSLVLGDVGASMPTLPETLCGLRLKELPAEAVAATPGPATATPLQRRSGTLAPDARGGAVQRPATAPPGARSRAATPPPAASSPAVLSS